MFQHLFQSFHGAGGLEGGPAGHQAIEQCPQGVDVRRRPDVLTLARRLLGRHVTGRADDLSADCQVAFGQHLLGQPKIAHLGLAVFIQQHVGRLQIAMHDAVLVGISDGLGDLLDKGGSFPGPHGPILDPRRQGAAFDKAHREKVLALVLADFEDRHDPGMVELGRGFRLGFKPQHLFFRRKLSTEDRLERHDAIELLVPRLVNHAHAATGDGLQQFVFPEGPQDA